MWMLVDVLDSLYVDTGQCFELNYHSLYVDAKMSYHAQMTMLTQINVPLFFLLYFLYSQTVSEYDQDIPQSHTADLPTTRSVNTHWRA